jgi:hypothetical protein
VLMSSIITRGNFHTFVCGLTQSGKSYFSHRAMLSLPDAVLYFNIQGETVPKGFVTVYTDTVDSAQLRELLNDKIKVNLVFRDGRKGYDYIAGYVMNMLMDAGFSENNPVYIGLDECHLLRGYSLEIAKYVATAGLKKGLRCIFITQRPANCDKTLYTQAFEHYIFFLSEAEGAYMKSKGIDYNKCRSEWKRLGEHSYCFYNGYELEGKKAI